MAQSRGGKSTRQIGNPRAVGASEPASRKRHNRAIDSAGRTFRKADSPLRQVHYVAVIRIEGLEPFETIVVTSMGLGALARKLYVHLVHRYKNELSRTSRADLLGLQLEIGVSRGFQRGLSDLQVRLLRDLLARHLAGDSVRPTSNSSTLVNAAKASPETGGATFNDLVGPFYDVAGVAHRLHEPIASIKVRTNRNGLLGCTTDDGVLVFPVSQFGPDGAPLTGLARVLSSIFRGTDDPWQVALWLKTPSAQLSGTSPYDALAAGRAETVERLAEQTAKRWQQ